MSVTTVHKIQSVQTKEFLIPFPKGGDRVVTTPADLPINFFVFTGPVLPNRTTTVTIRGHGGLYVHPGPHKRHIILAPGPYEWQLAPIGGNHQIYPAGEDLYWFQSKSTEPFVGLAPGRDLVENQPIFKLLPA
ncbi:hypothetical protein F5887DRAFT_1079600 [Amanita rubescens]|nr:hypothetical protein F5887DRAFT_1079600 [Amanita rubescens]